MCEALEHLGIPRRHAEEDARNAAARLIAQPFPQASRIEAYDRYDRKDLEIDLANMGTASFHVDLVVEAWIVSPPPGFMHPPPPVRFTWKPHARRIDLRRKATFSVEFDCTKEIEESLKAMHRSGERIIPLIGCEFHFACRNAVGDRTYPVKASYPMAGVPPTRPFVTFQRRTLAR